MRSSRVILEQRFQVNKSEAKKEKRLLSRKFWRWFFLIVVLFFLANLFIQIPRVFSTVRKPFTMLDASFANLERVDFSGRTNLLVVSTDKKNELIQVNVVTYEPQAKQIMFIDLPVQASVNLTSEKRTLSLLYQENFDRFFWHTSALLGVNLDGYLIVSEGASVNPQTIIDLRRDLFSVPFFWKIFEVRSWLNNHLVTNLTAAQVFQSARILKSTNPEKIVFLDLNETVDKLGFNQESLDQFLKSTFINSQVASEAVSVKIVNGSQVAGLGSSLKRVVSNLGSLVSAVDSGRAERTRIVAYSKKEPLAAKKMALFLGKKVEFEEKEGESSVLIILGEDFARELALD